ncbi:MAG TPA: hydroxysqualene dehydroxylase HpnE [Xanthobacteraceae bacterium]|nr:hydroxysqualene dehydroxylase HpnE [Xanthobacteraceae bacterium]
MTRKIHIIGAGLAGLAAAVRLAGSGVNVVVHEATGQAGGRCRSYPDRATGLTIDNGNHLVLSGNRAAMSYVQTLGTADRLVGPKLSEFPFVDLATDARWTLRIGAGRLPWWILDPNRRVPGTRLSEYFRLSRLLWSDAGKRVGDVLDCNGPLYERLTHPLLLAALNIDPPDGSAALAGAVIRETLAAGGGACRPLIARTGLSDVFVEPAIDYLRNRAIEVRLRHELRALRFADNEVAGLDFGEDSEELRARDAVIIAVPPFAASALLPELTVPTIYRAIVNAHFRADPPDKFPPMIGVLNATTEWIFSFPQRLSVTISSADRLLDVPREELAHTIWGEVARVAGMERELPPWQIVRERRATFAATPDENAKRPHARTRWSNLFLAGDWIATGLPATIESAIRSGQRAADLASNESGKDA